MFSFFPKKYIYVGPWNRGSSNKLLDICFPWQHIGGSAYTPRNWMPPNIWHNSSTPKIPVSQHMFSSEPSCNILTFFLLLLILQFHRFYIFSHYNFMLFSSFENFVLLFQVTPLCLTTRHSGHGIAWTPQTWCSLQWMLKRPHTELSWWQTPAPHQYCTIWTKTLHGMYSGLNLNGRLSRIQAIGQGKKVMK